MLKNSHLSKEKLALGGGGFTEIYMFSKNPMETLELNESRDQEPNGNALPGRSWLP